MLPPFDSSRLKIARARQNIDILRREVEDFLAREPFQIVVKDDKQFGLIGAQVWVIGIREAVPPYFSGIIGDAIHNLRTALDLLASDLATKRGKSSKGVHFPFADSESGLAEMIKRKNFNRAGDAAVDLLKIVRPYRGGNNGLRALHDLDVRDKHQALIPVGRSASVDIASGILDRIPPTAKSKFKEWATGVIQDGQIVVGIPKGWGPGAGTVIKADYVLTLVEGEFGHSLIGLLDEFGLDKSPRAAGHRDGAGLGEVWIATDCSASGRTDWTSQTRDTKGDVRRDRQGNGLGTLGISAHGCALS